MDKSTNKESWDRFETDVKNLAGELRRHYRGVDDDKETAELNRSLQKLREAAESVFKSLETATKDPEVRSSTRQAARSFGSAIAETFRDLGDELGKAVRKPQP